MDNLCSTTWQLIFFPQVAAYQTGIAFPQMLYLDMISNFVKGGGYIALGLLEAFALLPVGLIFLIPMLIVEMISSVTMPLWGVPSFLIWYLWGSFTSGSWKSLTC